MATKLNARHRKIRFRVGNGALGEFHFHDHQREQNKNDFDLSYLFFRYVDSRELYQGKRRHPSFNEYASGVLSLSDLGRRLLEKMPFLESWFPPEPLPGLDETGLWSEPKTKLMEAA